MSAKAIFYISKILRGRPMGRTSKFCNGHNNGAEKKQHDVSRQQSTDDLANSTGSICAFKKLQNGAPCMSAFLF
jgi:hypothetical protein